MLAKHCYLFTASAVWAIVFVAILAKGYYDCHNRLWHREVIVPDGRRGKIVSFYPFDLRVSVNVPATIPNPDEMLSPQREWMNFWRWEVKLLDKEQ